MSEITYLKRHFAGSSVSFEKNVYNTLLSSNKKGMYSIQFFMGPYISMNRTKISDKDIKDSNDFLKRFNIHVFTHLPYVLNLCGKGGLLADESTEASSHVAASISSIIYEINTISKVIENTSSKGGCVLHIGSIGTNKRRKDALDIVIKSINEITDNLSPEGKANLILETMVGRGGVIGTSFEELNYIWDPYVNILYESFFECIKIIYFFNTHKDRYKFVLQVEVQII
jgi:endonuclease IV